MNILQICFRMPYPLKDGGAIAMHNLTKGFHELGHNLTLLVPVTPKHDVKTEELPKEFRNYGNINTVKVDSEITLWGAFKNLFSNKSYYISRYESKSFEEELIKLLKSNEFDLVLIESIKVGMYNNTIRKYSNAKIVMRSHNIEFMIWERHSKASKGLKKWYLSLISKRLKSFEIGTLNEYDAIAPITSVDGEFFKKAGCFKAIFPTASGIDFSKFKHSSDNLENNTLFHLGALDWMPNQEAVNWFVNDIWPLIFSKYPELNFFLAGRNMPDHYKKITVDGINVVGEVENAIDFINSKQIMIVPLLSGSGMRIKIVEGMALGKIIISTTIGAEGIEYKDGENILIADSPDDFVQAITKLKKEPELVTKISSNAIELAKSRYDNIAIVEDMLKKLLVIIDNSENKIHK